MLPEFDIDIVVTKDGDLSTSGASPIRNIGLFGGPVWKVWVYVRIEHIQAGIVAVIRSRSIVYVAKLVSVVCVDSTKLAPIRNLLRQMLLVMMIVQLLLMTDW